MHLLKKIDEWIEGALNDFGERIGLKLNGGKPLISESMETSSDGEFVICIACIIYGVLLAIIL